MLLQKQIDIAPSGKALAAEICGLDLSGDLQEKTIFEIRNALLKHLVVIFRDQKLTPQRQAEFARRFGALQTHSHVCGLAECPEVIEIRKEPNHIQNFGGTWHSDNSYLPTPPLGSILYALEIPSAGGDTLWANQYAAYENLPQQLRNDIGKLTAAHSPEPAFGSMPLIEKAACKGSRLARNGEVIHPLIRSHPETRRKSLFHGGPCTTRIIGWSSRDSQSLLDYLLAQATSDEITYRHHWKKNDVVFWDNRSTMHIALNDYSGMRRVLHRVSIQGDGQATQ